MTFSAIHNFLIMLLPCVIPPYAFRLSRIFGTKRVGWILFTVFSLLALLQLIRAWQPLGIGISPGLTLDLLNFLIPMLLLIGMVHIELLFKEKLQREEEAQKLQKKLELEVKQRTADLHESNEELQREINLRRQGEVELRNSKEQYRFLFEENPQPMWMFDVASFRFLAFNRAALEYYGYTSAEFRELTAQALVPLSDLQTFLADSAIPLTGTSPRRLWQHRRKDGSLVDVEVTAQDLTYAGSSARLLLLNDVSSREQVQKQLLQGQKIEITSQVLSHVAQMIAPLVFPIESQINGLLSQCREPGTREALRQIGSNAASTSIIARQLLASTGCHPIRCESVQLNELIDHQIAFFSHVVDQRIQLQTNLWENLPVINADPGLVELMLRNLVLNGAEAMPKGGTITFSTAVVCLGEEDVRRHGHARPGTYVCLSVADAGSGISAAAQTHLFEPFFTTKQGHGLGLGLATVQGIIQQHSGWVEVSSHANSGSRFALFFPVVNADN